MRRNVPLVLLVTTLACSGSESPSPSESPDASVSDAGDTSPDAGMTTPDAGTPDAGDAVTCTSNDMCPAATPVCSDDGECLPLPAAHPIGWRDGSADSVDFERIYESPVDRQATDLEFNPARPNELWILHREHASNAPCSSVEQTQAGCGALEGSVTIMTNPESADRTIEWKIDGNAWHFMRRPPALAFGVDGFFATCGEERTGNFLDSPADFIGPTLWDSDPEIFAITPPGGNGSHMDMLHASPFCVGIAHEADNIYWVINGQIGSLDRYNFNEDHGPGNDDHSDGEIYRYGQDTVTRIPGVPSHLVYNEGFLYVTDTGGSRILRLDASQGERIGAIRPVYEPLADQAVMGSVVIGELVSPGTLERPSGLELWNGHLYVSDNATGQLHAFDMDGNLVRSLDTGLPPGSLAGLEIGEDGTMYFVDLRNADVYRIIPR